MKILTKQAVLHTRTHLGADYVSTLEQHWLHGCKPEYRMEYTFLDFLTSLIGEVAYRHRNGVDGNWQEFAIDWRITDEDFLKVLDAMEKAGYTKEVTIW